MTRETHVSKQVKGKMRMRARSRLKGLAVAGAVAAVIGTAGTALAVSGSATGSHVTYFGCVKVSGTPARVLWNVHTVPVPCPAGSFAVHWNQVGPRGPQGLKGDTGATGATGPQGPQGPPGPSDLSVTATTSVSGRDDSGNGANLATCPGGATKFPCWATDSFIRTITITRHEAAPVSNCGGSPTCWYYTGTISDVGTFMTVSGSQTPNQGCTEPNATPCSGLVISGQVAGNFTGGSDIEFYASSNAPDASRVPGTMTGDAPTTGEWYQQFFTGDTVFTNGYGHNGPDGQGAANLIDWSWTYNAPSTCEQWVDAFSNGAGNGAYADDGNIAGINECKA